MGEVAWTGSNTTEVYDLSQGRGGRVVRRRRTVIQTKRFRLAIMWGRSRFGFHKRPTMRGKSGNISLGWRAGLGFCVLNYTGKAH